jgi:Lrp/AsnC family transcriptional regulator for asnA, asnC and gidA
MPTRTPVSPTGAGLDDVDRRIIELLQRDGRLPYAQLGPAVGLSQAAARQRVQRLIDSKVIQIVAVADPRVLGFTRQAMIGLKIEGDTRRVANAVAALPEVEYVVLTAGALDMLVEVVVEDDEQLLYVLNDKIRAIDGVQTTETYIYLRVHKETYEWGRP